MAKREQDPHAETPENEGSLPHEEVIEVDTSMIEAKLSLARPYKRPPCGRQYHRAMACRQISIDFMGIRVAENMRIYREMRGMRLDDSVDAVAATGRRPNYLTAVRRVADLAICAE